MIGAAGPLLAAALALRAAAAPGAPAAAPAAAARPAIVAEVDLRLPEGEDEARLRPLVAVRPGDPFSRRALRRTVLALYGSGRCGDVTVHTAPGPGAGQVQVRVECAPRRTVVAVQVVDVAAVLEEERVRRAAGLAVGDELWPGRLEAALERVRAAYARRGYRAAQVDGAAEGDRDVRVRISVDAGPPTRVAALAVTAVGGPPGLAEGLATQVGAPLDLSLLDEDVRTVRARLRLAGFLRARVGTPTVQLEGAQARVELPVDPGPHVQFRFAGAAAFSPAQLATQLVTEDDQPLDASGVQAAAARLRAFYVAQGWAAARVSAVEAAGGGDVAVIFRIDEGRRYRVRSVTFPGARAHTPAWLRERLDAALEELAPPDPPQLDRDAERLVQAAGSPAHVRSPAAPEPREVWNPPIWEQAVGRLVEHCRAEGWLDAASEGTRVTLDAQAGTVDVEVRLSEGVQVRVEALAFEGVRQVPLTEVEREARIAPGAPLALAEVEATRTAILGYYARRGHVYARVTDAEDRTADGARATVRIRVEEGPQVRVGNVVISGTRRTRQDVVRDVLLVRPGDVYDPEKAARSQAALLKLGVFRSVGLHLADPDVPEATKDLQVEVAEGPYQTLSTAFGFSLANGPRAAVEYARPNVLGRALELTVRGKVNYPIASLRADEASLSKKEGLDRLEGRVEVGLRDPLLTLFGIGSGARAALAAERLHRPSYDLQSGTASFALELPISTPLSLALQTQVEVDDLAKSELAQNLTLVDYQRLQYPQGITSLWSIGPLATLDLRDSPINPRRGLIATASAEYTHSLSGLFEATSNDQNFLKASAGATGYVPLARPLTLVLSLKGGRILPFNDASIIPPKRFFLGGAASMRGYGEDEMVPEDVRARYLQEVATCNGSLSKLACSSVAQQLQGGQTLISPGGTAYALGKSELRLRLTSSLEAAAFVDYGNLWLDPDRFSLRDLRLNFGAGVRVITPIGPAVLDLGVNPNHDARLGESTVALHFSIGLF